MKLILFLWWLPLQVHSQVQGKVELVRSMFNPDNPKENLKISTMIWYQGKQSIQQVQHIASKTDSSGTQANANVKYYLFIDRDLNQYFYYGSFSDTSRIVKHFKGVNPFEKYGGWDLYSNKKFDYDDSKKLTDTVINGNNYSRYRFLKVNNGKENIFILYTSCEKKNVPVKYLKPFSEEIGCPVIRMDTYYEGWLSGITKLQYISDTLTIEEKKIFAAWDKKAKENRVHKN